MSTEKAIDIEPDVYEMSTLDLHHFTPTNQTDVANSSSKNEILDSTSQKYIEEALHIVEAELMQDTDLSKTIITAIESIASYVPEIEEERVKTFVTNSESLYYNPDDWKVNQDEISKLCEDCKEAQFDVSVNVVGMLFDLYGVPQKVRHCYVFRSIFPCIFYVFLIIHDRLQ